MPASKELALDLADVRSRLSYNPATGKLVWLRAFQSRHIGKEAGVPSKFGYLIVGLHRRTFFAHRLAWFIHYGHWPVAELDHIDRNGLNNRLANLRECTKRQNIANRRAFNGTKSGLKGAAHVRTRAGTERWRATICVEGKYVYLGQFDTPEEAHEVYMRAARRVHGEFASC